MQQTRCNTREWINNNVNYLKFLGIGSPEDGDSEK